MWAILKIEKKSFFLLKNEFQTKLGIDLAFYAPKVLIEKIINKKKLKKELNLLGDYIFCFHKKFEDSKNLNSLKTTRGLKYILPNYHKSQEEIREFIHKCKINENKNGYINPSFFELVINKKYKFINGPFSEKIFGLIKLNKNKISILLDNIKIKIDKNKFLFKPA